MSEGTEQPRLRVVVTNATEGLEVEPVVADSPQEEPKAPVYGVRADSPGPRGCWALKRDGNPCGAARRADGDYCNAHSGLGVAKNPAQYAPLARAASAENRRRRAALRATLGITRPESVRGLLKAAVFVERERVVSAAMAPLRDPDAGSAAKQRAALALLDAVEPQPKAAELTLTAELDPEGIASMGLSELRLLAERVAPMPPLPSPAT